MLSKDYVDWFQWNTLIIWWGLHVDAMCRQAWICCGWNIDWRCPSILNNLNAKYSTATYYPCLSNFLDYPFSIIFCPRNILQSMTKLNEYVIRTNERWEGKPYFLVLLTFKGMFWAAGICKQINPNFWHRSAIHLANEHQDCPNLHPWSREVLHPGSPVLN